MAQTAHTMTRRAFVGTAIGAATLLATHNALADELETADAATVAADAEAGELTAADVRYLMDNELANSFRFEDGQPVSTDESAETTPVQGPRRVVRNTTTTTTAAAKPWTKAPSGGYYSSDGSTVIAASRRGIDVSRWQGTIEWDKVKADDVSFAILRCSYGWHDDLTDLGYQDKTFEYNATQCERLGIPYGVYHMSYASLASDAHPGKREGAYALACLGSHRPTLPVYYDLELEDKYNDKGVRTYASPMPYRDPTAMGDIAQDFCDTISAAGLVPGVYSNLTWFTHYLTDPRFNNWERWYANYNSKPIYVVPFRFWQCAAAPAGFIDGINTAIDIDFDMGGTGFAEGSMFRLYNPYSGEHFYTSVGVERDNLISKGWRYEGVGWVAPTSSNTPVYRLYNQYAGDHHYTTSTVERDALIKVGWTYEGVGWYSDDAQGTPLYRQYNPYAKAGAHNYTTDKHENDVLVTKGWRAEGIGWYGLAQ